MSDLVVSTKSFEIQSEFQPQGDQPTAIDALVEGLRQGKTSDALGATGTGKTFTIAQTIAKVNRPTLVIAHNKTLARSWPASLKFFPNNSVDYFVSYYDYYQPEAYIPSSDTYIEKDSSINEEIDKLRHSATSSLFERRDVIIVASVSCIYGLGSPHEYGEICFRSGWAWRSLATRFCRGWSISNTSGTISTSCAARSACAGMSSRSSRPRRESMPSRRAVRRRDRTDHGDRRLDRRAGWGTRAYRHLPGVSLRHPRRDHAGSAREYRTRTGRAP